MACGPFKIDGGKSFRSYQKARTLRHRLALLACRSYKVGRGRIVHSLNTARTHRHVLASPNVDIWIGKLVSCTFLSAARVPSKRVTGITRSALRHDAIRTFKRACITITATVIRNEFKRSLENDENSNSKRS